MIALDSSAIVAIALREPEASVFLDAILSNPVLVGTPTLLETRIVLTKRKVRDPRHAVSLILGIAQSIVVPFDEKLLEQASEAFLTYGKGRHPARLNYGDCMAYAVAKALDVPLLYKGYDFARTDIRSAL